MNRISIKTNPYIELVASHLRSQVVIMHNVLGAIERDHDGEEEYIHESLRSVEYEIRRLRKFIDESVQR